MSRNTLYITLLALICSTLLSVSCQRMNGGAVPDDDPSRITCLRFSMAGIELPNASLREQGNDPSIQSDPKDYEDYVGELAVLIYKVGAADNQSMLVRSHFTTEQSFLMELQPEEGAKYHFCFVANYPESWKNTLEGLQTYAALKTTLQHLESFKSRDTGTPLYNGAVMSGTEKSLFPMARIYENQTIPMGGSVTVPKPFTPTTVATDPLTPVSNWPDGHETGTTQQTVNLVRSSAKVSLNLTGDGVSKIKGIKIYNVATQHSFMENKASGAATAELTDKPFNGSGSITGNSFKTKIYVPERLLGKASTTLGWDKVNNKPIGNPCYIEITMQSGVVHKIPVIANSQTQNSTPGFEYTYLDVATGNVASNQADYTIIRNHHYQYDIRVPADGKYLVIDFKVKPWTLIESEMEFTHPKYTCTLKLVDTLTNEETPVTDISQEVLLPSNKVVEVSFKITKPVGAIWSASITNGLNFLFTGTTYDQVEPEIVSGSPKIYTFRIKPRQPFISEPFYTQFYITVDGKELDLDPHRANGYMNEGGSERWRIKQVMY